MQWDTLSDDMRRRMLLDAKRANGARYVPSHALEPLSLRHVAPPDLDTTPLVPCDYINRHTTLTAFDTYEFQDGLAEQATKLGGVPVGQVGI